MRQPAPALLLPRGLILLSAVWLIGSWVIAFGPRTPVQPSSASFTPGVRLMTLCLTFGLMIAWPLLRLSQQATPWPYRKVILDLVSLLALVQVVLWPMRIVTNWPASRVAAIDATVAGWLLLAGALVASAISSSRTGPRTLAMLGCVGMCLLGPALAWLGVLTGTDWLGLIRLSPLMAVNTLGDGGAVPPSSEQWRWIVLLGVAAAVAWIALVTVSSLRSRGGPTVSGSVTAG